MSTPLISFASPKAGEWIILSKLNKQVGSIIYDPADKENPEKDPPWLIIRGWPNGFYYPTLKFNEFVADTKTAKEALIDNANSPDFGKKKYIGCRTFYASNYVIGTRQERVRRLKKIEIHPAVVEAISSDGASMEIILLIATEILEPLLLFNLDDDFLDFVASFTVEEFRLWAADNTFKDNRAVNTGTDTSLPDDVWKKIEKLNSMKFIPFGCRVNHAAVLTVTVKEISKDFLESEQRIAVAINDAQVAVHTKEAALQQNMAQQAFNETEIKFRKEDAEIKKDLINKTSAAIVAQNGAWGGQRGLNNLFFGGGQHNSVAQSVLEDTLVAQNFADDNTDRRRTVSNKKFKPQDKKRDAPSKKDDDQTEKGENS